jgi:hypothetical protein
MTTQLFIRRRLQSITPFQARSNSRKLPRRIQHIHVHPLSPRCVVARRDAPLSPVPFGMDRGNQIMPWHRGSAGPRGTLDLLPARERMAEARCFPFAFWRRPHAVPIRRTFVYVCSKASARCCLSLNTHPSNGEGAKNTESKVLIGRRNVPRNMNNAQDNNGTIALGGEWI